MNFIDINSVGKKSIKNPAILERSIDYIYAGVDLQSGRAKLEIQDICNGNGIYNMNISHIYNGEVTTDFVYGNIRTHMGAGFKLNIQQYLVETGNSSIPYIYLDALGRQHGIVCNNSVYYDTSGLGFIMTEEGSRRILTDIQGNQLIFSGYGHLIKSKGIYGDEIEYIYDGDRLLKMQHAKDSLRAFSFAYDSKGNLSKIRCDLTRREIDLIYNTTNLLSTITLRNGGESVPISMLTYSSGNTINTVGLSDSGRKIEFKVINPKIQIFAETEENTIKWQKEIFYNEELNQTKVVDNYTNMSIIYSFKEDGELYSVVEEIKKIVGENTYITHIPQFPKIEAKGAKVFQFSNNGNYNNFNGYKIANINNGMKYENRSTPFYIDTVSVNSLDKTMLNTRQKIIYMEGWIKINNINDNKDLYLTIKISTDGALGTKYVNIKVNNKLRGWQYVQGEVLNSYKETIITAPGSSTKQYKDDDFTEIKSIAVGISTASTSFNIEISSVQLINQPMTVYFDSLGKALQDVTSIKANNQTIHIDNVYGPMLSASDIKRSFLNYSIAKANNKNSFNFIYDNGKKIIGNVSLTESPVFYGSRASENWDFSLTSIGNLKTISENLIDDNKTIYENKEFLSVNYSEKLIELQKVVNYTANISYAEIEESMYNFSEQLIKKIVTVSENSVIKDKATYLYKYDKFNNLISITIEPLSGNSMKINYNFTLNGENKLNETDERRKDNGEEYILKEYQYNLPKSTLREEIYELAKKTFSYDKQGRLKKVAYMSNGNVERDTTELEYIHEKLSKVKHNTTEFNYKYDNSSLDELSVSSDILQQGIALNIGSKNIFKHGTYLSSNRGQYDVKDKFANDTTIKKVVKDKYGHILSNEDGTTIIKKNVWCDEKSDTYESNLSVSSKAKLRQFTDFKTNYQYKYDFNYYDQIKGYSYRENGNTLFEIKDSTDAMFTKSYDYIVGGIEGKSTVAMQKRFMQNIPQKDMSYVDGKKWESEYEYDSFGRIVNVKNNGISSNEISKKYTYMVNSDGTATTYLKNLDMTIQYFDMFTESYKILLNNSYSYSYDKVGNLSSLTLNGKEKYKYQYDPRQRLIHEDDIDNIRYIDYEYDEGGNRSRKIVKNNSVVYLGETTEYLYNNVWKDQLTEIKVNGGSRYFFKYDSCGNPTHYKVTSSTASANMKWNSPRQLASFTKNGVVYDYKYTASGERISKNVGNEHRQFYLDGTKIMGEDWGDYKIRYTYDSNGLRGFRLFKGDEVFDFDYVLDPFGNVIQVVYGDINKRTHYIVGEYSYDAFGNRTIVKDLEIAGMKMSEINPFYWKSHYFDLESGLYCINCRDFYDPETGRYINARNLGYGVKNITELNSFNTYIIECNPIIYPANSSTIVPSIVLYAEIDYSRAGEKDYVDQKYNDESNGWNWFAENRSKIAGLLIIGSAAVSIFSFGAASFVGVIIGAAIGAGIGAMSAVNNGENVLVGAVTGMIVGAMSAFNPFAAGLAAAGTSLLRDEVNGVKADSKSAGKALISGFTASLFAYMGDSAAKALGNGEDVIVKGIAIGVSNVIFSLHNLVADLIISSFFGW